ncbi:MAG TPA: AI-2E family transporter [Actinomycetota bacterium]|jgi:predicted PurR-regulated permease PerM|nr:AI-2E family transporter [Actinomycetota bacterium]
MTRPMHPHLPSGERLRRAGMAAWAIIGLLILLAISVWILLKLRVLFPPLVLALLVIYLLNPPISWLEGRGVPRVVGTLGSYVVILGSAVLIGFLLAPFVGTQIDTFSDEWPRFRGELIEFVEDVSGGVESTTGVEVDTTQFRCLLGDEVAGRNCDRVVERVRKRIAERAGALTEFGGAILEGLLAFILGPLLALYLLIDLPNIQRDVLNLFPEQLRPEAADVGSKLGRAVGGFFRGQLFVAFTVGALSALGFWIIGLPFWLIIGAIAGFFNLIPLVGPFIGGAIGFLVGTVTGGVGLGLKAALVELVVQQLDNHVVSPMVMRRAVQIHPATVVLALLGGGAIAGFWGVLLGVPAVAVGKILLGHLWITRVLGEEVTPFARTASPLEAPSVVPADREVDDLADPPP